MRSLLTRRRMLASTAAALTAASLALAACGGDKEPAVDGGKLSGAVTFWHGYRADAKEVKTLPRGDHPDGVREGRADAGAQGSRPGRHQPDVRAVRGAAQDRPPVPSWTKIDDLLGKKLQAAFKDQMSVQQALAEAAAEIDKLLAKD